MKEICVTTDYVDDLINAGRWYSRDHIDQLMAYSAALGARRHQWVFDTVWTLYDTDSPSGFDLMACACEAAHRHGMRFDVVFKPFEGGLPLHVVSDHFPRPEGVPLLACREGFCHVVRPFVAAHPEMQRARHPRDLADPGGKVAEIRLVGRGVEAGALKLEDFMISTGNTAAGGGLTEYHGPVEYNVYQDYRPVLPYAKHACQVLSFGGLDLPAAADFFLVRCVARDYDGNFTNEPSVLVELLNAAGEVIPSHLAVGPVNKSMIGRIQAFARLGISRYLAHPDVQPRLADEDRLWAWMEHLNVFRSSDHACRVKSGGALGIRRGKPAYHPGVLSPVYPEVRAHWLDHVRFCIERGVDGVSFRETTHSWADEPWAYGFDAPVRKAMAHDDNFAEAEIVNGRAYTLFLREAAGLLHAAGREMGVHVNTLMFQYDELTGRPYGPVPRNIAWEWPVWIREFADYVELRGAFKHSPYTARRVVDLVGMAVREAGKPLIFQSSRGRQGLGFTGPYPHHAWEMGWLRHHPDVTAYNLYETAIFTRLNTATGRLEGSDDIGALVDAYWR